MVRVNPGFNIIDGLIPNPRVNPIDRHKLIYVYVCVRVCISDALRTGRAPHTQVYTDYIYINPRLILNPLVPRVDPYPNPIWCKVL